MSGHKSLDTHVYTVLLDEYEGEFAHKISCDWRLPPRVAAAVTALRNFDSAGAFCDSAAVQLSTASLLPNLLNTEYLSSYPAFGGFGMGTEKLATPLMRADGVRTIVAQL